MKKEPEENSAGSLNYMAETELISSSSSPESTPFLDVEI